MSSRSFSLSSVSYKNSTLTFPIVSTWYSIFLVNKNDNHSKESSEIWYLQFNQIFKVYIWVKTSYYHPSSVPTGVSWCLYLNLLQYCIVLLNPGDLNSSRFQRKLYSFFSSLHVLHYVAKLVKHIVSIRLVLFLFSNIHFYSLSWL